jgi:hypothetical protein
MKGEETKKILGIGNFAPKEFGAAALLCPISMAINR